MDVIGGKWCQSHEDYSCVLGETAEVVEGILDKSRLKGSPDGGVVWMTPLYGKEKKKSS